MTRKTTSAENIVVSPFMVYAADTSNPMSVVEDRSVPALRDVPPAVKNAVEDKLSAKASLGPPADKTLDLGDVAESTLLLTTDRQAALDLSLTTLERTEMEPCVYTLAQTALMYSSIDKLYASKLFGYPLYVRVEEGLSADADRLARMLEDISQDTRQDSAVRTVGVRGLNRIIQTRGYELRGHHGESRIISDIPACEMYMAAAALDQTALGSKVVRILPWFMEDREEAARFTIERSALSPDAEIESIILGPSGDIKRIFGWNGHRPTETTSMLGDRKAHKAASLVIDQIHGKAASAWASARNGGKPAHMLFEADQALTGRVQSFISVPNRKVPIAEHSVRPRSSESDRIQHIESIAQLLDTSNVCTPTSLEVSHNSGSNTNSVATIRLGVGVLVGGDSIVRLDATIVYESVSESFLRAIDVEGCSNDPGSWLRIMQTQAESENATLRYILVEASNS